MIQNTRMKMTYKKNVFAVLLILFSVTFISCSESRDGSKNKISDSLLQSKINRNELLISSSHNEEINEEWLFEKTGVLGGYVEGESYYYSKSQLDTLHQNLTIVISGNDIHFKSKCVSKYKIGKEDLKSFIISKISEDKTVNDVKDDLKKNVNVTLGDSIIIYQTDCEYPYHRLIVFPNKILLLEFGVFYTVFSKKESSKIIDSNNVKCKDIQVDMGSGEVCLFEDMTLENVYNVFISSKEFSPINILEKDIPETNIILNVNKNGIGSIKYNWESPKKLIITISYDGGTKEIYFEEKHDAIERTIYRYAD